MDRVVTGPAPSRKPVQDIPCSDEGRRENAPGDGEKLDSFQQPCLVHGAGAQDHPVGQLERRLFAGVSRSEHSLEARTRIVERLRRAASEISDADDDERTAGVGAGPPSDRCLSVSRRSPRETGRGPCGCGPGAGRSPWSRSGVAREGGGKTRLFDSGADLFRDARFLSRAADAPSFCGGWLSHDQRSARWTLSESRLIARAGSDG